MNREDALAWFFEHGYQYYREKELDRVFQRLNYVLIANAFLIGAFASLSGENLLSFRRHSACQCSEGLSWIIATMGLVLSGLFWVMNTWNVQRTLRLEGDLLSLREVIADSTFGVSMSLIARRLWKSIDTAGSFKFKESVLGIIPLLFKAETPAWNTRYIPFLFVIMWATIMWAMVAGLSRTLGLTILGIALVPPVGFALAAACRETKAWWRRRRASVN